MKKDSILHLVLRLKGGMSGKMFNLEKQDFHKLRILNQDKCYQINIFGMSNSYFFIKEQILLLSPSAYKFIMTNKKPFQIKCEGTNSENAFHDFYLLFKTNESLQINKNNQKSFISITKQ
jgi:hypothetical protein